LTLDPWAVGPRFKNDGYLFDRLNQSFPVTKKHDKSANLKGA
jgi:hypothetical protein